MQTAGLQAANLSKQQERLWKWLQTGQIENTQCMVMLEGEFDPGRFQQALQRIVDKHEILHTTFSTLPGMDMPMQVVGRSKEIPCPIMSLKGLDASAQQNVLAEQWQNLQHQPLGFEHGPLINVLLLRLADQRHALMLRMCALCADASTLKHFVF